MSLFADSRYQWRETYFVLFDGKRRPKADAVRKAIEELKAKLEVVEASAADDGTLEAMTVLSHADSSGMDITFVAGEEVQEQVAELKKEWRGQPVTEDDKPKLELMLSATARYDIFHFEEVGDSLEDDDEGPLDPGTLLLVLEKLARVCHGVSVDPQSGALL